MPHIKHAQIRFRIIDKMLRNKYKPYPTKEELRRACEESLFGSDMGEHICDSTIEKDLFAMRMEHDAPIKYNKKEKGYYYGDDNFSLDNIPLNEDDIDALKFAANTLYQFKDVSIFKQFDFAINKILDKINLSKEDVPADKNEYVQFELAEQMRGNEYLAPLFKAIDNHWSVSFTYGSFKEEGLKEKNVVPLLLKEYRNRWYVIALDLEKDKIMTYGLDRIHNLILSEEVYEKKIDFNPDIYFRHTIGITAYEANPEKVVFKADNIAAKYIESQAIHSSQTIVKKGKNKTTFELTVLVTEELIRLLLSYGDEIEVKEPASLRNEITSRVQRMQELY